MLDHALLVSLARDYGAVVMMALLAARWFFSVVQLIVVAEAPRRSIPFDLLCLAAYFAGVVHYASQSASDAAGVVCLLNMTLILANVSLALYLRRRSASFARRLAFLDGRS